MYTLCYAIFSILQDILDLDMPDLPEDDFPTEQTEISIDIQLPSIASEVSYIVLE